MCNEKLTADNKGFNIVWLLLNGISNPYGLFKGDIWSICECLFGFYGISTFVGYLMPHLILYK